MGETTFEIDNVGGIEHAKLVLTPGVNVLRGRNGAGKTSAFRAIARAQGADIELERRDGSESGTVRGPGVTLRVGRVVRASGESDLALADTSPLSTLIDPGIQDSDAAARARLRALVTMLRLSVDDEAIRALSGGDEYVARRLAEVVNAEAIGDLIVAAERARGLLHAQARAEEAEAEAQRAALAAASARLDQLTEALAALPPSTSGPVTVEDAKSLISDCARLYEREVAACEARENLEARQAALRATIGSRPDPQVHAARAEALSGELAAADASVVELESQVASLQQRLAEVRAARGALSKERMGAVEAAAAARQAAERWDRAQQILAEPVSGPQRHELPELEHQCIQMPLRALERAERVRDRDAAKDAMAAASVAHSTSAAEASRLRELARQIPQRLGEILAAAGAPGLTVIDGRVCALRVEGGPLDFERRLSDGQRVRIALDVAAAVFGAGSVVPLDGDYWAALDPANRIEFAALAAERGLVVLTEEPAEGELRVEHAE